MSGKLEWKLLTASVTISVLYSGPFGYQYDILNTPQEVIEDFMVESLQDRYRVRLSPEVIAIIWALNVSLLSIGNIFGCMVAPWIADTLGRKRGLVLVANPIAILGDILLIISKPCNSVELLLLGRFISGVRCGISSSLVATYLLESAPEDLRGKIGGILDFCSSAGNTIAFLLGMPFILGNEWGWNYLLGLDVFCAIAAIFVAPCFPGSPKFHLLIREDHHAARKAIRFYHGKHVSTRSVIKQILKEEAVATEEASEMTTWELIVSYKAELMLSIVIGLLPGTSGYQALGSYSTPILRTAGMRDNWAEIYTLMMAAFELAGAVASIFINHHAPRRMVILTTAATAVLCNVALFTLLHLKNVSDPEQNASQYLLDAAGCLMFLTAGVAAMALYPLVTIIPAELAPIPVRALATSVGLGSLAVGDVATKLAIWPLYTSIGEYVFVILAILTAIGCIVLWRWLPETHTTFAEMDEVEAAEQQIQINLASQHPQYNSMDMVEKVPPALSVTSEKSYENGGYATESSRF